MEGDARDGVKDGLWDGEERRDDAGQVGEDAEDGVGQERERAADAGRDLEDAAEEPLEMQSVRSCSWE